MVVHGCDGAVGEGLRLVGDDEVGVEVDGVAEALAAWAGAVGIVEGEEARLGLAVGAMAGGALEGGGEAQRAVLVGFGFTRDGQKLNSRRTRGSRSRWRRRCGRGCPGEMARRSTRTKMGCVKSSSRSDSGVENSTMLPFWIEAVVAAAAEFGEAVFECVGEVEPESRFRTSWRISLCGLLGLWGSAGFFDGGHLHGLEFDLGADDGEERVGAGAFGEGEEGVTISSTVSCLTMPPQCRQVTVPQRA